MTHQTRRITEILKKRQKEKEEEGQARRERIEILNKKLDVYLKQCLKKTF